MAAEFLNSTQDWAQTEDIERRLLAGQLTLLYAAPERVATFLNLAVVFSAPQPQKPSYPCRTFQRPFLSFLRICVVFSFLIFFVDTTVSVYHRRSRKSR